MFGLTLVRFRKRLQVAYLFDGRDSKKSKGKVGWSGEAVMAGGELGGQEEWDEVVQ